MSEPGVGGAPDGEPAITAANSFRLAGGRRSAKDGPNPTPALLAAAAGASVAGVAAVLLRGLKLGLEAGFFDPRLAGEMVAWAAGAAVVAGLVLAFVVAPRQGLKLRFGHFLALGVATLALSALAAMWIGFPTAAQRLEYKVTRIAAMARGDSAADIVAFKGQAHPLQWLPRVARDAIDRETDLHGLRKTIADTADPINEAKTRLVKRRRNVRALLDVAVNTPEERARAQALYDKATGDLAKQEDLYWDQQAEAMLAGIDLVDSIAYVRGWEEARRQGRRIMILWGPFNNAYAERYAKLQATARQAGETEARIVRPAAR